MKVRIYKDKIIFGDSLVKEIESVDDGQSLVYWIEMVEDELGRQQSQTYPQRSRPNDRIDQIQILYDENWFEEAEIAAEVLSETFQVKVTLSRNQKYSIANRSLYLQKLSV